jgi:hypothetical protein
MSPKPDPTMVFSEWWKQNKESFEHPVSKISKFKDLYLQTLNRMALEKCFDQWIKKRIDAGIVHKNGYPAAKATANSLEVIP